jgi:nitroreductase
LGSVWIAGDKKDYCGDILKALGVPVDNYKLVSLICIGYPDGDFPVTPKKKLEEVIHWDKF